jgi:hypothetical protein
MKNAKTFDEFLFEGRYDRLTSNAVKKCWPIIKASKIAGESEYVFDLEEVEDNGIYFSLELQIIRKVISFPQGFVLDAGAYTTKGNNLIEIIINIDPSKEPEVYSVLNAKLHDAFRHEIEHLTQSGKNKVPGKPTATRAKTRDKINIDNKNIYKYFILRDEIPAMAQGMYKQAKKQKRPLDDVFNEYLQYFLDENIINDSEKAKILASWIGFAKKNLPAARYSNNQAK